MNKKTSENKNINKNSQKKSNKKIWIISILSIIGILLVITLIYMFRNFVIIYDLQNKIEQYSDSSNHHIHVKSTQENNNIMDVDYYTKDGKEYIKIEKNADNKKVSIRAYNNGERTDVFTDADNTKTVDINGSFLIQVDINNYLITDNCWQTFMASAFSKIKSEECNGKKCYSIENYLLPCFLYGKNGDKVYVEKETGLSIKSIQNAEVYERSYEFDNVDDKVFEEPDISKYTVRVNN